VHSKGGRVIFFVPKIWATAPGIHVVYCAIYRKIRPPSPPGERGIMADRFGGKIFTEGKKWKMCE
jgi:hypothetical protein